MHLLRNQGVAPTAASNVFNMNLMTCSDQNAMKHNGGKLFNIAFLENAKIHALCCLCSKIRLYFHHCVCCLRIPALI